MISEENVVSKVGELMSALDQVKRYKQLFHSMTSFLFILLGSVALFIGVNLSIEVLRSTFGLVVPGPLHALTLLLPPAGLVLAVLHVRGRVSSVKTGEHTKTLNEGVPGALKLLSDRDWYSTFNEIQLAKLGFISYGLLKVAAYWLIALLPLLVLRPPFLVSGLWIVTSLLIVIGITKKSLVKRFTEAWSLDMLLWELRWFDNEFRRAEFKA